MTHLTLIHKINYNIFDQAKCTLSGVELLDFQEMITVRYWMLHSPFKAVSEWYGYSWFVLSLFSIKYCIMIFHLTFSPAHITLNVDSMYKLCCAT